MSLNDLIICNLEALLKEAQTSKEVKDRFRAKAYINAIKEIKNCTIEITSGKDSLKLNGIGKKIADKIQEIIDTGELHQVNKEDLVKTKILSLFSSIWGIGPVKALELLEAGAKTINDLQKKNFINLLNDNQKIGLKYYKDLQKRVDRNKVELIYNKILNEIKNIKKEFNWKIKIKICGSFRRIAETCGDMDILLCEKDGNPILEELVSRLSKNGILIEQLGLGKTKYLGITTISDGTAFRIDMEVIKPCEWPYALLYFTGSGRFNEKQRLIAKKMGYSLSEHGLKNLNTGEYLKGVINEKGIFEFLKMPFIAPNKR